MDEAINKSEAVGRWPDDVQQMTLDDMGHFGVHKETRELFWKGRKLVTTQLHQLHWFERSLAGLAAASAVVLALLEIGRSMSLWP